MSKNKANKLPKENIPTNNFNIFTVYLGDNIQTLISITIENYYNIF